jgi:hypothetical protein
MKTIACVFAAVLAGVTLGTLSFAQPPDSLWAHTYGGPLADDASSFVQTADGGYVLAGYTYSFGAGNEDFWLVKTNANGDSVWSRTFGGPGFEGANSLQQTTDGGFILAGFSNSFGGGYNLWLVKTDANGNSSWSRNFGGPGWDGANCVLQTADGYLLAGLTNSYGAGDFDFWLLKTNTNGDSVWSRTFGGPLYEDIFSIQPTTGGGYILAGRTLSYGAGNYDAYLVKTNSSGDSLWTRHFGGPGFETATAVQQTADGGYVFAGITSSYGAGNEDFWLFKTNSNGDSVWSRTFGGMSWDRAYSIQKTADGGYILAGRADSYGAGQGDVWLVKTNANGDSLWSRTFGGAAFDGAYFVRQTTDSGFVLAGFTESFGAGGRDFWLVKTRRDPVSAGDTFILHPSSFVLSVFPNPFNPATEIAFNIPKTGHISLRVFDLLGREAAVLKDGFAEAGSHRVTFNGSDLPTGIYFARLDAGGFSQTKKLMLLK